LPSDLRFFPVTQPTERPTSNILQGPWSHCPGTEDCRRGNSCSRTQTHMNNKRKMKKKKGRRLPPAYHPSLIPDVLVSPAPAKLLKSWMKTFVRERGTLGGQCLSLNTTVGGSGLGLSQTEPHTVNLGTSPEDDTQFCPHRCSCEGHTD
jgi:hypothetical protein